MLTTNEIAKKSKGRVYTPNYIVSNILDMSHYTDENVIEKHVIDNSCGDGAFLCEIVNRYCAVAHKKGLNADVIKVHLEKYIHGIEIEPSEHEKCLNNINNVAKKHGIECDINWDIICDNALNVKKFDGKMDFVLGNPPYVRIHNLDCSCDTARRFLFAQYGMTDLYIVFYEIGLKMLNKQGILGYITPSSFFNSLAGNAMRAYFVKNNLIESIVDLKHYQAFNATTYTTIVILNNQHKKREVEYYQFDEKNLIPYYVETLLPEDYYIAQNFYFSTIGNLTILKKIFYNLGHCNIEVKNGYATLCDSVFIGSFDFSSGYIIPVIKASRGEKKQIIYPYDKSGRLIAPQELKKDEQLYAYLTVNKEKLLNRSCEYSDGAHWYAFGRSQAITDTYKDKISINTLLRTVGDLKIEAAPTGTGVYSGLYLIGEKRDLAKVSNLLKSEEFLTYISLLGKYKSGGYYTFSSKDLKAYLDYKLAYYGGVFTNDKQ